MSRTRTFFITLTLLLTTVGVQGARSLVAHAATPTLRAAESTNTNTKNPSLDVPSEVRAGDQLVLIVTASTNTSIATPDGWSRLGFERDGKDGRAAEMTSTLFTRTATSALAGKAVTTPLGRRSKVAMSLVAYANATAPAEAFASVVTGSSRTLTTAPVNITLDGSLVVSYWSNRTSSNSAWSLPSSVTARTTAFGTGGGRITAALADSIADSGPRAGQRATAPTQVSKAISWTTIIAPATSTPEPPISNTPPTTTTPPTTLPPTPPPAECQVSDLLVPSCGVWLGATTPSRDGNYDFDKGLAEYENVAQNTPDILHFYKTGAMPFPKAWEIAQSERPGKQRSLLMYNWKPSKTATWRQIANGAADSEIATVAANLKKYPNKLFLNIYHEPEDQVRSSASSGMTAADYADMYRYVVDKLGAHGVTNAVYVWNPMGYYGWRQHLDDLYPGNNYVDWVCYDPYAKDNIQSNFGELINRNRPDINWPGFYNWATAKAPGKPLAMCEWGVDLITNTNPAGFLQGDAATMLAKYPMLKAVIYWNDIDKVNARIDENTTKGKALGTAYRNFANQPIFNQMTPNNAP